MSSAMLWDAIPASGDVDMHVPMNAVDVEPWEASMDADLDPQADSESVEIDMEEYDISNEFEMAEDSHTPQPDADVEFHDASAVHSPFRASLEDNSLEDEDAQVIDLTSQAYDDATAIEVYDYIDPDQPQAFDETPILPIVDAVAEPEPTELYSLIEHEADRLPDPVPILEPLGEVSIAEHPTETEAADIHTSTLSNGEEVNPENLVSQVQPDLEQEVVDPQDPPEAYVLEEQAVVETAYTEESHTIHNEPVDESDPGLHPANPSDDTESQQYLEGEDPIEIDEGIYIDPPPGVPLILPSDDEGIYLFNHPRTGSNTPTSDTLPSGDSRPIILQHLPTLYYESLSTLFGALREDSLIASMPQLTDSELFLEALGLDLSISEDNIYAREVSVHDINQLHDGLGLSGILRLQLRMAPRFIARYKALERLILQDAEPEPEGDPQQPLEENEVNQPEESVPNSKIESLDDNAPKHDESPEPVELHIPENPVASEAIENATSGDPSAIDELEPVEALITETPSDLLEDGLEETSHQYDGESNIELTTTATHIAEQPELENIPNPDETSLPQEHVAETDPTTPLSIPAVQSTHSSEDDDVAPLDDSSTNLESEFQPIGKDDGNTEELPAELEAPLTDTLDPPAEVTEEFNPLEDTVPPIDKLLDPLQQNQIYETEELEQDVSWADLAEAELYEEEQDLIEDPLENGDPNDDAEHASVESSVTLGSVNGTLSRKRSFDEVDGEENEEPPVDTLDPPDKRLRVE